MKARQRRKTNGGVVAGGNAGASHAPAGLATLSSMADRSPTVGQQQARQLMADSSPVQRMDGLDEEALQGKAMQLQPEDEMLQGKALQRVGEEEDLMQGKAMPGGLAASSTPASSTSNTGLPGPLRTGVESLSGVSMENVRVHYNSNEPAAVQAKAYAQGQDIHLGPGQEHHLAHEAWHVVQQQQGRVAPTMMANGVAINDSPALETEADIQGARAAASGESAQMSADD